MKPGHHLYRGGDLAAKLGALAVRSGSSKSAVAADARDWHQAPIEQVGRSIAGGCTLTREREISGPAAPDGAGVAR